MSVCYCKGAGCGHMDGVIPDGERVVSLAVTVDWGAKDLRAPWTGEAVFGSFACLAQWATDRAGEHDGRVLVEGRDEAHGNEVLA